MEQSYARKKSKEYQFNSILVVYCLYPPNSAGLEPLTCGCRTNVRVSLGPFVCTYNTPRTLHGCQMQTIMAWQKKSKNQPPVASAQRLTTSLERVPSVHRPMRARHLNLMIWRKFAEQLGLHLPVCEVAQDRFEATRLGAAGCSHLVFWNCSGAWTVHWTQKNGPSGFQEHRRR